MKKIILSLLCLMMTVSMNAQVFEVYKNGELQTTYQSDYKIVMREGSVQTSEEYVDLGLPSGTLWAKKNVGATSESDYGSYFMWGATRSNIWDAGLYPYGDLEGGNPTKYNESDGKTVLELTDDAATVIMGNSWRMPIESEWKELTDNCTLTKFSLNGVNVVKVTGINGNCIYLPCAGYYYDGNLLYDNLCGCYWTSTLDDTNKKFAKFAMLQPYYDSTDFYVYFGRMLRYAIAPIRAVRVK